MKISLQLVFVVINLSLIFIIIRQAAVKKYRMVNSRLCESGLTIRDRDLSVFINSEPETQTFEVIIQIKL